MNTDPRLAEITARAHASDIPWLVAELIEALAQLAADGKVIDDLRTLLVERDEQIAGLLHSEVTDEEPAGVPW